MTQDEINLRKIKERIGASDLDGNIKIKAVHALDIYFESHGRRCSRDNVDSFFTWDEQPEGHQFWMYINNTIGYGDTTACVSADSITRTVTYTHAF